MGTVFLYDGSVDGLLCAVAVAIKSRETDVSIAAVPERPQQTFFDLEFRVVADPQQLERLWRYLKEDLNPQSLCHLSYALLYDSPDRDMVIYNYIKASIKWRRKLDFYHTADAVRMMHDVSRKVSHETHRFKGLLRFRELKNRVLYAPFNPDHRIVYPLAHYFRSRLGAEKWLIHDLNHQMAVYWDGDKLQDAELETGLENGDILSGKMAEEWFHEDEKSVQQAWRTFFEHIAIKSRANPKLQRQFMPRRYWPYLTEEVIAKDPS